MGASASKATRAAGATARKYPSRSGNPPPTQTTPSTSTPSAPRRAQHYPPPPPDQQFSPTTPGPTVKPPPSASSTRNEAINLDASDPDFARSLRQIGPVQPNPTLSPSSAFPNASQPQQNISQRNPNQYQRTATAPDPRLNPAITVLTSRARLQDQADLEAQEAGRRGHPGREFLDVFTIRQILVQRDEGGVPAGEIERKLGLKKGVVERLGRKGMVGLAREQGRAEKGVEMV